MKFMDHLLGTHGRILGSLLERDAQAQDSPSRQALLHGLEDARFWVVLQPGAKIERPLRVVSDPGQSEALLLAFSSQKNAALMDHGQGRLKAFSAHQVMQMAKDQGVQTLVIDPAGPAKARIPQDQWGQVLTALDHRVEMGR